MPFVIDASITACWAFDDEDHPVAALALDRIRADEARVPSLWWFEVCNTLIVNERRGRLTEADVSAFLRGLSRLGVMVDREPDEDHVLMLARRRHSPSMTPVTLNSPVVRACRSQLSMPILPLPRIERSCS